jgi:Dna[CI] antecedent DciA-like protein
MGDLRAHWSSLVGPLIAGVSSPLRMGLDGQLVLRVRTAAWAAELQGLQRAVVDGLPIIIDGVEIKGLIVEAPAPPWTSAADDHTEGEDGTEAWRS